MTAGVVSGHVQHTRVFVFSERMEVVCFADFFSDKVSSRRRAWQEMSHMCSLSVACLCDHKLTPGVNLSWVWFQCCLMEVNMWPARLRTFLVSNLRNNIRGVTTDCLRSAEVYPALELSHMSSTPQLSICRNGARCVFAMSKWESQVMLEWILVWFCEPSDLKQVRFSEIVRWFFRLNRQLSSRSWFTIDFLQPNPTSNSMAMWVGKSRLHNWLLPQPMRLTCTPVWTNWLATNTTRL